MNKNLSLVFQGLGQIGALFLSDSKTVTNKKILKKYNIKAVISVEKESNITNANYLNLQRHLCLYIQKMQDFPIQKYFDRTFTFIDQARKYSNVLIHFEKDINQSVTIVLAYLIRKYHYQLPQIKTLIEKKIGKIKIPSLTIKNLEDFSQKYSVSGKKSIVKRSSSVNVNPNESIKDFFQNHRLINSDVIKKKQIIESLQIEDCEQIQKILKKRQQIQSKLRNLRYYLVRGRFVENENNEQIRQNLNFQVKNDPILIQERLQMSENRNPNLINFQKQQQKSSNIKKEKRIINNPEKQKICGFDMTNSVNFQR